MRTYTDNQLQTTSLRAIVRRIVLATAALQRSVLWQVIGVHCANGNDFIIFSKRKQFTQLAAGHAMQQRQQQQQLPQQQQRLPPGNRGKRQLMSPECHNYSNNRNNNHWQSGYDHNVNNNGNHCRQQRQLSTTSTLEPTVARTCTRAQHTLTHTYTHTQTDISSSFTWTTCSASRPAWTTAAKGHSSSNCSRFYCSWCCYCCPNSWHFGWPCH